MNNNRVAAGLCNHFINYVLAGRPERVRWYGKVGKICDSRNALTLLNSSLYDSRNADGLKLARVICIISNR